MDSRRVFGEDKGFAGETFRGTGPTATVYRFSESVSRFAKN